MKISYYRSAFFEGQIEQPVRGLTSLMTHQDIPVIVGINFRGVYVIDDLHCVRPEKTNPGTNYNCYICRLFYWGYDMKISAGITLDLQRKEIQTACHVYFYSLWLLKMVLEFQKFCKSFRGRLLLWIH